MVKTQEPVTVKTGGRPIYLVISFAVSLVVLVTAFSNLLRPNFPQLALSINPLSAEARFDTLTRKMLVDQNETSNPAIDELATGGIKLEPVDARFTTLFGVSRKRQGDTATASAMFKQSLALLPTEIQALLNQFAAHFISGDYAAAVSIADIVLRRWVDNWESIAPYMSVLLENEAAYSKALNLFSAANASRGRFMDNLTRDTPGLAIANRMLVDWHARGVEGIRPLINLVTHNLVLKGSTTAAYALFLKTLTEDQRTQRGYVFNSRFDIKPVGNRFGWRHTKQSGMAIGREKIIASTGETVDENAMVVRFLNTPVKLSNLYQLLKLPPASYELAVEYSSRDLKAPKPIILGIECLKRNVPLVDIELEDHDKSALELNRKFVVPASDCPVQQIRIYNNLRVESWQNRFSGLLRLHSVSINLVGS